MNSSIVFDFCIFSLESKLALESKFQPKKVKKFAYFSQFKDLFSEFFEFIVSRSIIQFNNSKNICIHEDVDDVYDLMYHNFNLFIDMALDCIHYYDISTLCDGLSTQIKKFVEVYEHCYNIDKKYGDIATSFESVYNVFIAYSNLIPDHIFQSLYNWNMDEIQDDDFDGKQLKSELYVKRVQGHRQDYDQHIFNRGQNKKRREHGFRLRERKNKKRLDHRV